MNRDELIKKHISQPTDNLRRDINALLDEFEKQLFLMLEHQAEVILRMGEDIGRLKDKLSHC